MLHAYIVIRFAHTSVTKPQARACQTNLWDEVAELNSRMVVPPMTGRISWSPAQQRNSVLRDMMLPRSSICIDSVRMMPGLGVDASSKLKSLPIGGYCLYQTWLTSALGHDNHRHYSLVISPGGALSSLASTRCTLPTQPWHVMPTRSATCTSHSNSCSALDLSAGPRVPFLDDGSCLLPRQPVY